MRRFNFVVGETTPYLQEVITWRVYVMHGFFCACSCILVYFREYLCPYLFPSLSHTLIS